MAGELALTRTLASVSLDRTHFDSDHTSSPQDLPFEGRLNGLCRRQTGLPAMEVVHPNHLPDPSYHKNGWMLVYAVAQPVNLGDSLVSQIQDVTLGRSGD